MMNAGSSHDSLHSEPSGRRHPEAQRIDLSNKPFPFRQTTTPTKTQNYPKLFNQACSLLLPQKCNLAAQALALYAPKRIRTTAAAAAPPPDGDNSQGAQC